MTRRSLIPLILLLALLPALLSGVFAIYGDTRSNDEVHKDIITEIAARHPRLAFHTGDLTSKGMTTEQYENWRQISSPLLDICPVYPAKGNHERDRALFLKTFPYIGEKTWYTVEEDSLIFIVLDTTSDLSPGSEQYLWLKQITSHLTKPALVFMHHPVFSSGEHGDELGLSLYLPKLFTGTRVLAVFSAHDHDYERSVFEGIQYVVTGGGGAPLREGKERNPYSVFFTVEHHYIIVDEAPGKLTFNVYDLYGAILESFSISLEKKD